MNSVAFYEHVYVVLKPRYVFDTPRTIKEVVPYLVRTEDVLGLFN